VPTTQNIIGFLLLSMVIILVPGPSVLFAIGRALVLGTKAALISVFGNALGVGLQILIVALGLGVLIQQSPDLFFVIKVVGALMIGYLGLKAIWQRKKADAGNASVSPSGKKVLGESIVVGITNAKTLVFFIAALPSFVDPSGGNPSAQMLILGVLFLTIGVTSDSVYAIAAGKARNWLGGSEKRLANFRGLGGLALMFLGLYMLLDALL
jgi:threonine/homoserine/homoserine lactone efflux protein